MASETVLTEAEAPEVLRLPYQSAYGLNPFVSESFANRAVMSLVYEPLFQVNGSYVAEPVLAESPPSPKTEKPRPSPPQRRCLSLRRGE